MANISEKNEWQAIPQIEDGEVFDGGIDGNANKQAKALANRTAYLKKTIETHTHTPADIGAAANTFTTLPSLGNDSNKFYPVNIKLNRAGYAVLSKYQHDGGMWTGRCDLTIIAGTGSDYGGLAFNSLLKYTYHHQIDHANHKNSIKQVVTANKTDGLIVWIRGTHILKLCGLNARYTLLTRIDEDTYRFIHSDSTYDEYKTIIATGNADGLANGLYADGKVVATTDQLPTSLPANGGNADTVDGKHADDFSPRFPSGTFKVAGDENTFYPVTFFSAAFPVHPLKLTITRRIHSDEQWKGSCTFTMEALSSDWGAYPPFQKITNYSRTDSVKFKTFVANAITASKSKHLIVWLRGNTSYNWVFESFPVATPVIDYSAAKKTGNGGETWDTTTEITLPTGVTIGNKQVTTTDQVVSSQIIGMINGKNAPGQYPRLCLHIPNVNYTDIRMSGDGCIHFTSPANEEQYKSIAAGNIYSNGRLVDPAITTDISNQDLNTWRPQGAYRGCHLANSPNGDEWYWVQEMNHANVNWRCQELTSFGAGFTPNLKYSRVMQNSIWTEWRQY